VHNCNTPNRIVGMISDMENLPARYLSAEQCRTDAATDEVGKAAWFRFAEEWTKLADEAELSAWRTPPAARREPSGRRGSPLSPRALKRILSLATSRATAPGNSPVPGISAAGRFWGRDIFEQTCVCAGRLVGV
jgi:hypothetical protein